MARIHGVGIVGMGWVSGAYIKAFTQEPRTEVRALCIGEKSPHPNPFPCAVGEGTGFAVRSFL